MRQNMIRTSMFQNMKCGPTILNIDGSPHAGTNSVESYLRNDNNSGFDGIPRAMTGLGTKLKEAGYATHYIGKWDAGWATPEHTPFGRGFDSFLGFLQAENDYWSKDRGPLRYLLDVCLNKFRDFSHYNATYRGGVSASMAAALGCNSTLIQDKPFTALGCDMDNRSKCLPDSCYEEAMFLEHAKQILQKVDKTNRSQRLFLTLAHHLPHSPMQVPESFLQKLLGGFEVLFTWFGNLGAATAL